MRESKQNSLGEVKIGLQFRCGEVGEWEKVPGGFFCGGCQKKVWDMRGKPRSSLLALGEGACALTSPGQLDQPIEELLVRSARRRLRVWEIFLLALAFCFGSFAALPGQNSSGDQDTAIGKFFYNAETECRTYSDPGPVVLIQSDSLDHVVPDQVRLTDDRWIIILRDPLFFQHMKPDLLTYGSSTPEVELRKLGLIMDSIMDFEHKVVNVYGHAGPDEINPQELSRQRAEFVAQELRTWGIRARIVVWPMGTSKPNEEERYRDFPDRHRRVEVILTDPEDE